MYLYNEKRGTLHIRNYCSYSKGAVDKYYLPFETEAEAEQYAGGVGKRINMCKICQKKREQILKGEK